MQEEGGVMAGGQKRWGKRSIEAQVEIDGFELRWELRSEPQSSTEHGIEGLSLTVQRIDGAFRELILEYPFPKKGRRLRIDGKTYLTAPNFPIRPKFSPKTVEADIRQAIAAGWDPTSRGRPFIFQVPENSK
jgi:hypothetical protein